MHCQYNYMSNRCTTNHFILTIDQLAWKSMHTRAQSIHRNLFSMTLNQNHPFKICGDKSVCSINYTNTMTEILMHILII